jgi:hypothetical protein
VVTSPIWDRKFSWVAFKREPFRFENKTFLCAHSDRNSTFQDRMVVWFGRYRRSGGSFGEQRTRGITIRRTGTLIAVLVSRPIRVECVHPSRRPLGREKGGGPLSEKGRIRKSMHEEEDFTIIIFPLSLEFPCQSSEIRFQNADGHWRRFL